MFRFFRKHSWILIVTLSLTIISFVFFMGSGPSRMGGGSGGNSDFGSIYGRKITQQAYAEARKEFYLYYFVHYHEWPERNPNVTANELERETYIRLMMTQKAEDLGIYVSDDAAAADAIEMLRSLGSNGHAASMDDFVKEILQPANMTADDFERFARHDLAVQQLIMATGLAGALVTPQAATAAYTRNNQELSAQIVFFSASNYLSQVAVMPDAVREFYTNYLAAYRLPDRVQVSYVEFSVTNFLAQSKAEWAKTNFDNLVDETYAQYGAQSFPDAKTPAEGKAKLREILIHQRALTDARVQANELAVAVFNLDPPKPENLAAVAKQKGLAVKTTAPFDSQDGPEEFSAPEGFTKTAFGLTPDYPFANPIAGPDAIYVIALVRQLPSEIPPFDEIRERVVQDFQMQQAVALAQSAGTNFVRTLTGSMAAGKSFASVCAAAGLPPQVLPPFSLSTRELPGFGDRVDLNQLKQAAFSTAPGRASGFEPDGVGGFIVYVQSQLPVDQSAMNAELPQFTATLRRSRQSEAFNQWLGTELHTEFGQMKVFQQQ
jgi:hypothetical protein